MRSSASVSKPLQNCSRVEIPGQAWREKWLGHSKLKEPFLIYSDAKLLYITPVKLTISVQEAILLLL